MDQPSRRRISDRWHNRWAAGHGPRLPLRVILDQAGQSRRPFNVRTGPKATRFGAHAKRREGPQPEVRGRAANFTKNVRRNDTAFDGNRCNPRGSIGLAATGANAILQPDLSVYKTAGASLDTLVLDKVDIWANR
jgi:hypothetical protein